MSQTTNRLQNAYELLHAALDELEAATRAVAGEEVPASTPSVVVVTYEPGTQGLRGAVLGVLDDAAQAFEHMLVQPENAPFRQALGRAMTQRLADRTPN